MVNSLWTSIAERHECKMDTIAYFTFFAHASQYFSTKITPSPTLNKASWVALRPQVTQNFGFELVLSSNDLRCIKFFCIFKSFPHKLWWNCCCNSSICHSFVNIPTIYIRTCLLSLLLFNSSLLEEGKKSDWIRRQTGSPIWWGYYAVWRVAVLAVEFGVKF